MITPRSSLSLGIVLAVSFAGASAVAQAPAPPQASPPAQPSVAPPPPASPGPEAPPPVEPAPLPTTALHIDAYGGYTSFQNSGGGPLLGVDALARWRFLQAGALAEFNSITSSPSVGNVQETVAAYAFAAGLGFYRRNFAADALVVVGAHNYQGLGATLDSNGASCTLGFAGLRGGFSFVRLRPLTLGLWGYVNDDLARTNPTFTVDARTPGATPSVVTASAGEFSYGGGLRIGVDLEL